MSFKRVTQSEIETALGELGLITGSRVMVHSSLSSFGRVEGGAATVVTALKCVVTETGTILMPSFNHGAPFGDDGVGYYDPDVTPTTNGAIPDHFWRQPKTYRSLNPTHPFAAWGNGAEDLVAAHHLGTTMGIGSPLYALWQDGGSVLLLGVGFNSNTFHHTVESTTGAPCLGKRSEAYPVKMPDGTTQQVHTWGWRDGTCPITDENRYGDSLAESGEVRHVAIGSAECTFFGMSDCYDAVAKLFENGLYPYPPCTECSIRPRRTKWTVN